MKLLFLTAETWPTFRADVAVLFGRYLPELGVRSDLVAGRTPGAGDAECAWPGGQACLGDVNGGLMRKRWRLLVHALAAAARAPRGWYDAVQVRDMPVVAAYALAVARWKRLPFYYWMSYPMPEGQIALARERGLSAGVLKFLYPWVSGRVGRLLLRKVVLRWADHVFVQSEVMKSELHALGVPLERLTPVPMGVDLDALERLQPHPVEEPRLRGRRVIGYLGTIDRPRRIEVLFRMLALVRQSVPEALLLIVGDTDDQVHREWLLRQAAEAGVSEHVVLTGWQPTARAWALLRHAEVALSPFPRGELLDSASPTKVPEYLALGLPVVCNDNPDQQAAIQASGAGLCVPYAAQDFASAVLRVFSLDADTRHQMAQAGRNYVRQTRDYRRIAEHVASTYALLQARSAALSPGP